MIGVAISSAPEESIDALDAFARLVIGVGVNVQSQQELIVAAPLDAITFMRSLGRAAYARGASLVTAIYDDPELLRTRLLVAKAEELDRAEDWLSNSIAQKLREGAAYLSVLGPRPELLAGVDIGRMVRAHNARVRADAMQAAVIANMDTNASVVPFVTSEWARQVFPESEPGVARRLLWSALIDGVGGDDPATSEQTARQRLHAGSDRRARLQASAFRALQFMGPGIRITIGLAEGHIWRGGQEVSSRGVTFATVLPGEALFTATAPERTEGAIKFSRPIAIGGECVDDLEVHFEAGTATRVTSRLGQHAFEQLLSSDPGARRLGKVALVDATAPLARQAICFHNPMLDAAAAPHIAFGAALPTTLRHVAAGNGSAIHVDAMFESARLSVDGIDADGTAHAVLRDGVFVL
jgi:aminopeptidase